MDDEAKNFEDIRFDLKTEEPMMPQVAGLIAGFRKKGDTIAEIVLMPWSYTKLLAEIKQAEGLGPPPEGQYYKVADVGKIRILMGMPDDEEEE